MEPGIFTFRLRMHRTSIQSILDAEPDMTAWVQRLFTLAIEKKRSMVFKERSAEENLSYNDHYKRHQGLLIARSEYARDTLHIEQSDEHIHLVFEVVNDSQEFTVRNEYGSRTWLRELIESHILQSIGTYTLMRAMDDLIDNGGEKTSAMKADELFVKAIQDAVSQTSMYAPRCEVWVIEGEFD